MHRVHAYLAVTCHLHLRQNDRDLLHATAATQVGGAWGVGGGGGGGWNDTRSATSDAAEMSHCIFLFCYKSQHLFCFSLCTCSVEYCTCSVARKVHTSFVFIFASLRVARIVLKTGHSHSNGSDPRG